MMTWDEAIAWVEKMATPASKYRQAPSQLSEVLAKLRIAARAEDVMLRRGWWPCCDSEKWFVAGQGTGILVDAGFHGPWPDPFTALVEADRWYTDNVEAKQP